MSEVREKARAETAEHFQPLERESAEQKEEKARAADQADIADGFNHHFPNITADILRERETFVRPKRGDQAPVTPILAFSRPAHSFKKFPCGCTMSIPAGTRRDDGTLADESDLPAECPTHSVKPKET